MSRIFFIESGSNPTPDLRDGLTDLGYEIIGSAQNSEDAEREIERTHPDLIFMDVTLNQELDGIAVSEAIHRRFAIPVLFLISESDRELLHREQITLPFGYMLKPGQQPEFHSPVEMALFRHQKEKEVAESEKRYRELFENSTDVLFTLDLSQNFTSVNRAMEELTGYSRDELLQRKASGIVAAEYSELESEMTQKTLQGEMILAYELEIIRKDGQRRNTEQTTQLVFRDGAPVGIQGIARDITERKKTQLLLAERERVATFAANVGVALTRGATLRAKLEQCAEAMVRDLGARIVSLWTTTAEGELTLQAARGEQEKVPSSRISIPMGQFRIGAIAEDESPMLVNLLTTEPTSQDRQWARDAGMVAFAGYPLICNRRVVGVMALFTDKPMTRATLIAMASVADAIALAIDRVRTDEALRQSEERYRDLVENSEDLIYTHSVDGTILTINQAMLRKIGAPTAESVTGRSIIDFIVPAFRDQLRSYLETVRREGHASGLLHAITMTGEQRVLEYAASLRTEATSMPVVRGRAIDVTERDAAEKALRESEKRFRILFESSLGFIITHDLPGVILSANPAAATSLGYTPSEMIGKKLVDLVTPESVPQMTEYLERIGKEGIVSGLMVIRTREGAERIWEFRNCLYEEARDRSYVIGYSQDITERKKIEQAKDELVAIVAHELRSPITSIRGSLEYLAGRMQDTLPEQAKKLIDLAFRNTKRLVRLINDLLDMDKIESGKMAFEMKTQEILPLLRQSVEAMQPYADQYQARLVIADSISEARVAIDSDRFLQVMTNLLSNASKFTPAGEAVEVSVTRTANALRIAVRDHGPGIPERFQGDVFKKFSQADTQKGGSGLGLSISKAIVEKLGGTIGFQTQLNDGTTFYVDFPDLPQNPIL